MSMKQIIGFRRPVSTTYIYDPYGRGVGIGTDHRMVACGIRMALEANENWSELERVLGSCLGVYLPRPGGYFDRFNNDRFESSRAQDAVRYGEPFGAKLDGEVITLTPKEGVTLTVKQGWIDRNKTPIVTITFADPAKGVEMKLALNKLDYLGCETVEWEQALTLKPWTRDHWVFSNGSKERLGERVENVHGPGSYFQRVGEFIGHRVVPLPGETLVVYSGSGASAIDLTVGRNERTRHPDMFVFASVGPYSLAFRRGEQKPGQRNAHDRIVVFEDQALPIVPPKEDEDGTGYEDGVLEPSDHEYPDDYYDE